MREPSLLNSFRRLREGKLFQVETKFFSGHGPAAEVSRKTRKGRRVEHYWLCDCSPFVTLTFDEHRGVITVPLSDGTGQKTVKIVPIDEATQAAACEDSAVLPSVCEVRK